ncbi:MAG: LysR family transcriptional regulator [Ruminococcaceae bacterium]|nr:LysR family transcriptional regulator [Oscillospiraceae bacterium]
METIAKYAYQVYKRESFSKAAKDLYISQPSLSAAISRLENELGFRIFDRSTLPCSLTPEGRIYIESLEEIMESENNMRKRITAISDTDHGYITVGGSSFASYLILSEICDEFYKKHPKINVTLDIGNVGNHEFLLEKLDNHELDILVAYIDPRKKYTKYISEPFFEERLVIAMNKKMNGAEKLRHLALTRDEILTKSYYPDREIEDTSIFGDIEFLSFPRRSQTEQRMVKILGNYKTSHYEIQNARHSEMHYNLMSAGIGAVLTSSLAIAQKPYDENILFFMPKSEDSYRKVFLVYNYSSKNNPLIKSFINVAKSIYLKK